MDDFVDKEEGFSLAYEDDGTKYTYYHRYYDLNEYLGLGTTYKQDNDILEYTKMQQNQ